MPTLPCSVQEWTSVQACGARNTINTILLTKSRSLGASATAQYCMLADRLAGLPGRRLCTWAQLDLSQCYNWTPIFFSFLYLLVMWSSCDHFVTYCSCDIYCSVTPIVLWPIVQGDSIVPVTPIVPGTLLFSFTISTGSLWPCSLRLDFLYLTVHRAIKSPFPHSSLVPSLSRYLL